MVTVINFKTTKNKAGDEFNVLELQGDVELIKSSTTGKFYAHARKATITSTLNSIACKGLIGSKFPGIITKIESEPYAYKVPNTNDTIMLTHTYQYVADQSADIAETIFQGEIK